MKPFDLDKAKAGCPVQTRGGLKARIIAFDMLNPSRQIVALVEEKNGLEHPECYTPSGSKYLSPEDEYDLMMAPVGYVPIYPGDTERL